MKKLCTLLVLILAAYLSGCNLLQKSDLVRKQKQRNAANKYVAGNWIERTEAVREIIRYIGPDKNDLIIGTLMVASADPHIEVRIEAVKGLSRMDIDQTRSMLRRIAREDPGDNVRWRALRELRLLKDPAAADIYIQAMGSSDWLIREEAARGMLSLADEIIRARMIPHIIKALNDPSASVAIAVMRNLKTRDPRLYQAIADRLLSASEYSLLSASLTAINGYRLDDKTNEKVINLLVHGNADIRVLALRVLKSNRSLSIPKKAAPR